jgi:uncharacterized glyoxalase superfamily protein PhnB
MHAKSCNSPLQTRRNRIFFSLLTAVMAAGTQPVMAGPNDFFGSTMPAGQMADPHGTSNQFTTPGQAKAAEQLNAGGGPGDYTDDEKRMQKKYKASVSHAKGLIAKGDKMMKSPVPKESTKGKILKEIGEKRLAELEANNPIPHENKIPDNDKFKEKKAVAE